MKRVIKSIKLVLHGMEVPIRQRVIQKFSQHIPNVKLAYGNNFDGTRTIEGYLKTQ
jgi:hypothetical protein